MSSVTELWQRLRPRSLRSRLIVWNSGVIVMLFALLGIVVYWGQAQALGAANTEQLARETAVVQTALARQLSTTPPYWPAQVQIPEIDAYTVPGVSVVILDAQGNVRYASAEAERAQRLPLTAAARQAVLRGTAQTLTLMVDRQQALVALVPVKASTQVIGYAVIARSLANTAAALASLRWLLLGTSVLALGLAMAGGWQVTQRALLPLTQIARTAENITRMLREQPGKAAHSLQVRVPQVDDAGEPGALVTTVNHMLAALDDYDQRQRRFVADASHELRTPLTTIRGNLEFLRRATDGDPVERDHALQDASAEAERMAVLINDLLALARAETGGALPRTAVELDAVVMSVFGFARERARALGLAPDVIQLTAITPSVIIGDATQLRQLVLILMDNALKYAPGPLTLALRQHKDQAVLTVRDTGPGIAAEDLPHIFDRFYRADRARDREGSGLGLAIAYTIATQHGGTIAVTSRQGHGTTFRVRLPVAPAS